MGNTIEEMYQKMDLLVGKLLDQLKPDDLTFVMSDHGFSSFRRCINLNTWLYENGYLALKTSEPTGLDYLQEVDWSKTRAFALGLTGLYVNRKGRERQGIVPEQQSKALLHEIKAKLEGLNDPEDGLPCIKRAYLATESYKGLYVDEAPDLILGYAPGYRVSWDCVTGIVEKSVFSDNLKAWSGDHHVDPSEVPGVLFCNRALELKNPSILDLAPTALSVFGVKAPSYMEGKDLCSAEVARN
jgi:predicted AlkP superfamily phosphohydrolase/phosphomutase